MSSGYQFFSLSRIIEHNSSDKTSITNCHLWIYWIVSNAVEMVESVKRRQELSCTTARGTPYRQRPQKLTNNLFNSRIVACLKKLLHREVISVNLSASIVNNCNLTSPQHSIRYGCLWFSDFVSLERKQFYNIRKLLYFDSKLNTLQEKQLKEDWERPAKVRLPAQKVFFNYFCEIYFRWLLAQCCRTAGPGGVQ